MISIGESDTDRIGQISFRCSCFSACDRIWRHHHAAEEDVSQEVDAVKFVWLNTIHDHAAKDGEVSVYWNLW